MTKKTADKTADAAPAKTTTRTKKVADPVVAEKPKKVAAKATVAKSPAAKPAAEKPAAAPKKKAVSKAASLPVISAEERHRLIEVAAYYLAERRGFHGTSTQEDWLQAEQEIDAMISAGKLTYFPQLPAP